MGPTGKVLIVTSVKKETLFFHGLFNEFLPGIRLLFPPLGEGCLDVCMSEEPDLVMLDIFSAGLHGPALCRQLKERLHPMPVLAVTRKSGAAQLGVRALEAGADACLALPADKKEILALIRLLLRVKALEDAVPEEGRKLRQRLHECESLLESVLTDRQQAEESVLIERDFAKQVLNAMGQGLTITNSDGVFQYVNAAYAELLGYPPSDLLGRKPLEFTHKEDIPVLTHARNTRMAGESNTYEARLISRNGTANPVIISGVPYFRGGSVAGTIAVITDISELKQKERELIRVSDDYERIFNVSREALFLVEVLDENNFRFVRTNPTHQAQTGISIGDISGKTPFELLGEEVGKKINDNYHRCVSGRTPVIYEESIPLPAGKQHWETTLTPVIEDDRVVFIVGSSINITEFKNMEKEIGAYKEQAGAKKNPSMGRG